MTITKTGGQKNKKGSLILAKVSEPTIERTTVDKIIASFRKRPCPKTVNSVPATQTIRYSLVLQPILADDRPPVLRLRGLLKAALRAFGLRCIEVNEIE